MSTVESSTATRSLVFVESIIPIEGTEVDNVDDQFSLFRGCVLEGRWDFVLTAYRNVSNYHKIKINESRGTALHVAVNDGKVELVYTLVGAILNHEGREVLRDDSALKTTNEGGDTPLHLAASRGFIGMCKCIIGEFEERKDLVKVRNNKGETPIFRAVLTCQTKTFVYLNHVSKDLDVPLGNSDGDTILHHAIWREFLDLAIIITHCYPGLVNTRNNGGATPLKVLASKPSVFKSGSNLPWWKQILYYCILVDPLDAEKAIKSYMDKVFDDHVIKVTIQLESEANKAQFFVEKQYATFVRFLKRAVRSAFKCLSLLRLGITAQDLKAIKKIRQKHKWGRQLLNIFMARPYESYMGITGGQPFVKFGEDRDLAQPVITQQQLQMVGGAASSRPQENNFTAAVSAAGGGELEFSKKADGSGKKLQKEHDIDRKETAFLAAARSGIVEIVFMLLSIIPSAIHETNSNNENVLLVAVKNRQTNVVEELRRSLDKELFDSLILEVDNLDNTVLHLAAGSTNSERTWQIPGTAMQIMWDIKWYQYIRALVPEYFTLRINKDGETAGEVFMQNHKHMVKQSSEWLKETSNSCSTVAALVAAVSFAASSTVPGGTDKGKPTLEGQPAFDAFAIASLMALCFSVTALIMFLAILTSEKQLEDFRKSLPLKLLVGLSSLFLSIASMIVSFCIGHFFVLKDKYKNKLFPLYIATCFPVIFYAIVQFPLYYNIVKAIFKKLPQPSITTSHF